MTAIRRVCVVLIALSLSACGGSDDGPSISVTDSEAVSKATCGEGDQPEVALQGQVPAALRSNFQGFSCNLKISGQYQGEGGSWSTAAYKDASGRTCAYYATAYPFNSNGQALPREHPGVAVVDISNIEAPRYVTSLTTKAMLDPWESLVLNPARGLLIASDGQNLAGGPEIDVYDVSGNCAAPQLLANFAVGTGTDGGIKALTTPSGHEGSVSPDGLTYYVGDWANKIYWAVDIANPSKPKLIASFDMKTLGLGGAHGLSVSEDGNRIYVTSLGMPAPQDLQNTNAKLQNGIVILDTTAVQARAPDASMKLVSTFLWKDGSTAQHTIPINVAGKSYLVEADEGGAAGVSTLALESATAACNAKLPPFAMARIIDLADEKKPKLASNILLEVNLPGNCQVILPDLSGLQLSAYSSHYCTVDNRENATAIACSSFNSGIRVFDIRSPSKPKEIAYFNPPAAKVLKAGSMRVAFGLAQQGEVDWCSSRSFFDFSRRTLTTMCMDNGLLNLAFADGTWPFVESTPSNDQH